MRLISLSTTPINGGRADSAVSTSFQAQPETPTLTTGDPDSLIGLQQVPMLSDMAYIDSRTASDVERFISKLRPAVREDLFNAIYDAFTGEKPTGLRKTQEWLPSEMIPTPKHRGEHLLVVNQSGSPFTLDRAGSEKDLVDGGNMEVTWSTEDGELRNNSGHRVETVTYKVANLDITVILDANASEEEKNTALREVEDDFRMMSGLYAMRLRDGGGSQISYDGEARIAIGGKLVNSMLPVLNDQVDILANNWQESKLWPPKTPTTIPNKMHFVWLSKTPDDPVSPLENTSIGRMKSWMKHHGADMEYNVWTNAENPEDLKLDEFFEYARKHGAEHKVKINNIATLKRDFDHHLSEDKKLAVDGEENDVSYADLRSGVYQMLDPWKSAGARSDILRLIALYMHGGTYADINDTVCYKRFDGEDGVNANCDFAACIEPQGMINTAIISAKQHSDVLLSCLATFSLQANQGVADAEQAARYQKRIDGGNEPHNVRLLREDIDDLVVTRTGPINFTKAIVGYLQAQGEMSDVESERVKVLPSSYFYPGWGLMDKFANPDLHKEDTVADHKDGRAYLGRKSSHLDPRTALGMKPGASPVGLLNVLND